MDSKCSLVSYCFRLRCRCHCLHDRKTGPFAKRWFVGLFSIGMYWLATWLTFRGTSLISRITSQGFLLGTVLPGVVIIVMAVIWIIGGNPIAFEHIPTDVSQVANVVAGMYIRDFSHI